MSLEDQFHIGPAGFDLTGPTPTLADLGAVHFLGIGGIGMSAIARIMLGRGIAVSGSDAKDVPALAQLRAVGAVAGVGFDPARLSGVDTVVCSSAVRANNPELIAARDGGLRVLHRAQALAALMAGRTSVAVTGTNGKTTTTAMVVDVLRAVGLEPSFAIGGELISTGTNGEHGGGTVFVAEADESDASFLVYSPAVAVITGVQADHLDHYGTPAAVAAAFAQFVARLGRHGVLIGCLDDAGSAALVRDRQRAGLAAVGYGRHPGADVVIFAEQPTATGTTFQLVGPLGGGETVRLAVPGRHNVENAAAAYAAARALDVSAGAAAAGLSVFAGTRRRFELRGEVVGVRVFDDYAHNPPKVAAAVAAARQVAGAARVVVAFQPHLFTRTRDFAAQFGQALSGADIVAVLDVYAAREDPLPGVTGRLVADAVGPPAQVTYLERPERVPEWAAQVARAGDVVVTIGAGDITAQSAAVMGALASTAAQPR